jgi:predicted MFS family arabinose efflux permease
VLGQVTSAYREAFRGLPRRVWLLAVVTLVNRSGTMVVPFLSLYLTTQLGYTISQAGRVVALYGIGSVLGSLLGGWLADHIGAVRVVRWSLIGTGAGFLLLSQVHSLWALAATVLSLSVVAEAFRPAMLSSIALAAPPEVRTRSMSLLRLAINLGMSVGPAIGGLLAVKRYLWLFLVDAGTCWAAVAALAAVGLDDRAHLPAPRASRGWSRG